MGGLAPRMAPDDRGDLHEVRGAHPHHTEYGSGGDNGTASNLPLPGWPRRSAGGNSWLLFVRLPLLVPDCDVLPEYVGKSTMLMIFPQYFRAGMPKFSVLAVVPVTSCNSYAKCSPDRPTSSHRLDVGWTRKKRTGKSDQSYSLATLSPCDRQSDELLGVPSASDGVTMFPCSPSTNPPGNSPMNPIQASGGCSIACAPDVVPYSQHWRARGYAAGGARRGPRAHPRRAWPRGSTTSTAPISGAG